MRVVYLSAFMAALVPVAFAIAAAPSQQAAQSTPPVSESESPKNLQVLSKDLTVRQVKEIMDDWTDALGVDCSTCHVRDMDHPLPNGRPGYDYAGDSKQEKRTARVMYAMTEEINARYVAAVPNSGIPVTCGTCHRGHLSPVPFNSAETKTPVNSSNTAQP